MVITTTRITQMHYIVRTLQDGPESVKEILWSEGPWLGEEYQSHSVTLACVDRDSRQSRLGLTY